MKAQKFYSPKKCFLRVFRHKCCLNCLYFKEEIKECWAPWAIQRYEAPESLAYFFDSAKDIWWIGSGCNGWA